jgi:hypothetical protein
MMKAQHPMLLLAAALAVVLIAIPRADATSGSPAYVSVDLTDAPFEEALRQLFSGQMLGLANYVVESEPPAGALATVEPTRMRASEALALVLSQYGMTYRWVGHTVRIFRDAAHLEPQRRLVLYLRRNGDRTQLRLRAYPYENGGERLLWESPKDVFQYAYCLPSPSFEFAAVAWYGASYDEAGEGGLRLLLVPLAGGNARRIATPQPVAAFVWTQADALDIVGHDNAHWRFQPSTGRLTDEGVKGDEILEAAYAVQVRTLEALPSKARMPVNFPANRLGWWPVCAAVHEPLNRSANIGVPLQAAVSPDGRYAALIGAEAAVYIVDTATGAVRQKIPATRLVDAEGVALGHPHWSQNSMRLLFTESHFHAARFHVVGGQVPSATDWTELVREYALGTGRTETLTIGYGAYLVPTETASELSAGSNPRDWQSADDWRRWGRYATGDTEEAAEQVP